MDERDPPGPNAPLHAGKIVRSHSPARLPTSKTTQPRKTSTKWFVRLLWGALAVVLGALAGLGTFTFGYGQGASYLSNDPQACANCHIMQDHFNSWQNSSHRHVAVCNDCHLSHHPIGKWVTKADNGIFHSLAFTLENFHEPIQIKPRNARVTQQACVGCHQDLVHAILPATDTDDSHSCVHCHRDVGHALR